MKKLFFTCYRVIYGKYQVHPNQKKYPGQKILFVIVEDFVYMVPLKYHEKLKFLPPKKQLSLLSVVTTIGVMRLLRRFASRNDNIFF